MNLRILKALIRENHIYMYRHVSHVCTHVYVLKQGMRWLHFDIHIWSDSAPAFDFLICGQQALNPYKLRIGIRLEPHGEDPKIGLVEKYLVK